MKIGNSEFSNIADDIWVDDTGSRYYYSFKMNDDSKIDGILDYSDKNWNSAMKLAVAKAAVAKLKNEHKQLVVKDQVFTFDKLVQKAYKLNQKANFVEFSYYEKYIKEFIGDMDILEINSFDIKKIFDSQYSHNLKLSTLRITYDFLDTIFKIALTSKVINDNPCISINIQVILEKIYIKTIKDKLNELYNVASIIFKDQPLYLAFVLFILHGKRKKDLLLLKWELIDLEHNSFYIKPTKKRRYYLHPTIKEELVKIRKNYGFLYKNDIELNYQIDLDIKDHLNKINQYIPDFNLSNIEYLVEQLQERQVFGEDVSSYNTSTQESNKPKPEQKRIVRSKTIKPKLNIGKFSKKT